MNLSSWPKNLFQISLFLSTETGSPIMIQYLSRGAVGGMNPLQRLQDQKNYFLRLVWHGKHFISLLTVLSSWTLLLYLLQLQMTCMIHLAQHEKLNTQHSHGHWSFVVPPGFGPCTQLSILTPMQDQVKKPVYSFQDELQ